MSIIKSFLDAPRSGKKDEKISIAGSTLYSLKNARFCGILPY